MKLPKPKKVVNSTKGKDAENKKKSHAHVVGYCNTSSKINKVNTNESTNLLFSASPNTGVSEDTKKRMDYQTKKRSVEPKGRYDDEI